MICEGVSVLIFNFTEYANFFFDFFHLLERPEIYDEYDRLTLDKLHFNSKSLEWTWCWLRVREKSKKRSKIMERRDRLLVHLLFNHQTQSVLLLSPKIKWIFQTCFALFLNFSVNLIRFYPPWPSRNLFVWLLIWLKIHGTYFGTFA